jgi:hypothetical protein
MEQQSNKRTIVSGVIAVAVLVVLVGSVMALKAKEDNKNVASSQLASSTQDTAGSSATTREAAATNAAGTMATSQSSSSNASTSTGDYKNGTYTASGSYTTPESTETISVTVTLSNDTVSDVSINGSPQAHESQQYQELFKEGYKSLVVGKNINSISLSRVSGSSLTSRGFNDAIAQIENEAKA